MTSANIPRIQKVVVVGAGLVGLSIAWFLQEHDVEVTVVDRKGVAAGSTWGNAGWISPDLVLPLPNPSVLRYGLKSLVNPSAALYVPATFDPALWRFLLRFAANCTMSQWRKAMSSYVAINSMALGAYDDLAAAGLPSPTHDAPIIAAFEHHDQSRDLRHELELLMEFGQSIATKELTGDQARSVVPQLSRNVTFALRLNGQRFFDPAAFAVAVAGDVTRRGGHIRSGVDVTSVKSGSDGVTVISPGERLDADAVVIATGAWLNQLAHDVGVRQRVQAGRGYSFSVTTADPVHCPIYFPALRIACTPYRGGLRVGGTMEFRRADDPIDPRRVNALVAAARPVLHGLDWSSLTDTWVGPRPVVADGLPLIGASANPRVFISGGHGMWGITLGPISGKLLAQQLVTGTPPAALRAFSPLR